ncbi:hypothetical protein CVCC1112_717 [Paenarthrobacter nicotinovorans]|uniref:PIN domain-containing protein n=1 Tax=Paenarthrobacter nicotinovorans TaxID=29320 RepID=UPI0007CC6F6D|nr:PIN domain-containing protein [Paenarthrobacter nicotinovorans]GAT86057.1 hypothetical protein CVCC1112_717 [Paenarthrobacter nicotinovorans]
MTETPLASTRPLLAVIDSNAVHGAISFEGRIWQQIAEHQKAGRVELFFPEVVLKELTRQKTSDIRDATKQKIDRFKKALKDLERSKANLDPIDFPKLEGLVEVHMGAEFVRQSLEEAVARVGGHILPAPSVDADHLAAAATGRKKPFKLNGEGTGDYLIWRTIVLLSQSRPDAEIWFVSANWRDFSAGEKDKGTPHADLADALPDGSQCKILQTLGTLSDLLKSRSDSDSPAPGDHGSTHDSVADEDEPAQPDHTESRNSGLDALVAKACVDYLDTDVMYQEVADHNYDNSAGLELIGNAYPREIQNATVSYIEGDPETVVWQLDENFNGTTVIGTATIEGEIELEGYMFKSELALADASSDIHVSNSNHNHHMAEVTFSSDFIAQLGIRIEGSGVPEITELMSIKLGIGS